MSDQSQAYDKILKENLADIFLPFFQKITGIVNLVESEDISLDIQKTLERKPDFLKKINHSQPFILHLEMQSSNDNGMLGRMQVYDALLFEKYNLPIRQYVLYIGNEKMKMSTNRKEDNKYYEYNLLDIRQFGVNDFLNSETPEMIILAILANFQNQKSESVIDDILIRLQKLALGNLRLAKCVRQLEILSTLRKLNTQTLKRTNNMPIVLI